MRFDSVNESETSQNWRTLRELLTYLWPKGRFDLRLRVVLAMLSLIAAKALNVGVPYLLKRTVDLLTSHESVDALSPMILGLIVAYAIARFCTAAFAEFRDFIFAKVSQHTQRVLALTTFQHIHSLSLAFHLDRQTGGLTRAIERGTRGIQTVLSFMLFNILPTLLEVGFVTAILWSTFGWRFAAVTLTTIFVYIVYTLSVTDWRVKFRKTMNQKDSDANTKAVDSLLNYETVKYFGNEEHEYARYDRALAGYESAAVKSQTSLTLLNLGQNLIIGMGLISIMWLAARGVLSKVMTVGDFVLVNTYLIQLYLPLNFLGVVYRETKQSLIDMEKMFELLNLKSQVVDREGALPLFVKSGDIEFDQVSFSYDIERPILKNISFRVGSGKTVAIVGPSGAGKSTISRLLFRFYDVTQGSIRIGGTDIRDVQQVSVRKAIGIVPQDTVLFNDTIGYNIRYGNPEARESEVANAARMAKIENLIQSLPKKYESLVGERGLKLSGGEKQRVAIARTILKNPPILLFDEATSALDSRTEREIQASLKEVSRSRTTLVIAHRLSTVVDADEILVLKDGEIVERGKHEELMNLKGEYSEMWKRQAEARLADDKTGGLVAALMMFIACILGAVLSSTAEAETSELNVKTHMSGSVELYQSIQLENGPVDNDRFQVKTLNFKLLADLGDRFDFALRLGARDKSGTFDPAVVEAYAVSNRLLQNVEFRGGKFLLDYGSLNESYWDRLITPSLPGYWVRFLGEAGTADSGLEAKWKISSWSDSFVSLSASLTNGSKFAQWESNGASKSLSPALLIHPRYVFSTSPNRQASLGVSYVSLKDSTAEKIELAGLDLTIVPLKEEAWDLEFDLDHRMSQPAGLALTDEVGAFALARVLVAENWKAGTRLDADTVSSLAYQDGHNRPNYDVSISPLLTYAFSKLSRLTFSYSYLKQVEENNADHAEQKIEAQFVSTFGY
jgi:ABC-type transport system involved in Fe-S cluster assembly fused permease/ATPase subunit